MEGINPMSAELKLHRREWTFYVELDEGEVPDIFKRHAEITFRPTGLYFRLTAHRMDVPRLGEATIAGPRIGKTGKPTMTTASNKYYGVADLPDWAIRYYDQAVREVVSGKA